MSQESKIQSTVNELYGEMCKQIGDLEFKRRQLELQLEAIRADISTLCQRISGLDSAVPALKMAEAKAKAAEVAKVAPGAMEKKELRPV